MAKGKSKKTPPSWSSEARAKTYRDDEAFREGAKKRAREAYRTKAWGDTETVNAVHWNLQELNKFGEIRKVDGRRCRTYTVPEVAGLLGRSVSIYRRWLSLQQIPSPSYDTEGGKVYLMAEVRAFATVLAEHFDELNYYRQDHVETKQAVWNAYWAARGK